jgi:hypothetical protein
VEWADGEDLVNHWIILESFGGWMGKGKYRVSPLRRKRWGCFLLRSR